ncbi:hypothetical protein DOTSEDRAFT_71515 [Dothistroma septosporum NZE10]|uniref:RRM domain-containing protein n=1 Tax=Dothistroma septosporum (strain NZE10 / CBS 128990) TaxID=675120 RepID=N1PR26_DOTSN|nr:hypothetical protein DOTSEDRAFT_71515 [Dothistroma septosporum NZE10]
MGDPPKPPNNINRSQQPAMYARSTYSTNNSISPPTPSTKSDVFSQPSATAGTAQIYGNSPTAERHFPDRKTAMPALIPSASDPASFAFDLRHAPAVLIRRLPRTVDSAALNSMLLFAEELLQAEFTHSPYPDDNGFATAIAYFQTPKGALDAQQKLHGKPNATKEANMIVEAHNSSAIGAFERRNTIDGHTSRTQTSSTSSASSGGAPPGRSRFNSTFLPNDKVSPPLPTPNSGSNGDFPLPENSAHYQNLFSPQSPLANGVNGSHRVSGKSMINDDNGDDETGELLKDPVAYAKSGQQSAGRRATYSSVPVAQFGSLSLSGNTNGMHNDIGSPVANDYHSPRGNPGHGSSAAAGPGANQNGSYMSTYPKVQYPPVNPADQNPPCNTLYVGNLPVDTSEDELKSLFMKQRGYRRLCFRTKQNGPMCFVEFEDISFATKALNELYGHPLHNSVKGGIRLSFSKNPLGVRTGQTNGLGPNAVMSPQAMSPGFGALSAVSGPPPGLGSPSNFVNGAGQYRPSPPGAADSMFSNAFGAAPSDFMSQMGPRGGFSGGIPPSMGNGTFGKDTRKSFSIAQQQPYHNGQHYAQEVGRDYQNGQLNQQHEASYQNGDLSNGYNFHHYQNGR